MLCVVLCRLLNREGKKRVLSFHHIEAAMDMFYLIALICLVSSVYGEFSSSDERALLLEFKESISDPQEILKSWGANNGSNHCSWFGVSCDSKSRVSALEIRGNFFFCLLILLCSSFIA